MPVPQGKLHIHGIRGDLMEYAQEYQLGETKIRIVAPPPMTQQEIDKVLDDFHNAGWAIINELVEKGEDV